MPKVVHVNWFRKTPEGEYLWPGYGENARVLKWIFERCDNTIGAVHTPIGYLPSAEDIDMSGLDITIQNMAKILSVNIDGWMDNVSRIKNHFEKFGDKLPKELAEELHWMELRLKAIDVHHTEL